MTQIEKYVWLIDTIRRSSHITFAELQRRWLIDNERRYGEAQPLSRSAFKRWKRAVADLFGIDIECNHFGDYTYYISNLELIEENQVKEWMFDSFAVGNLLMENISLKKRILIDNIPSGHALLAQTMEAMRKNHPLLITYKSFTKEHPSTFEAEPYCVKMCQQRWYMLARSRDRDSLRIYAFDRILSLQETNGHFEIPDDFDAQNYFAPYFGVVTTDDVKVERIVVRARGNHRHYVRTLPIHRSQKEIAGGEDYADFELYLAPTFDFIMELLKRGDMIEVLSPHSVRECVAKWIDNARKLYGRYQ